MTTTTKLENIMRKLDAARSLVEYQDANLASWAWPVWESILRGEHDR